MCSNVVNPVLCRTCLQLCLHWRLSKRKCETNNMMEYVSIWQGNAVGHNKVSLWHLACACPERTAVVLQCHILEPHYGDLITNIVTVLLSYFLFILSPSAGHTNRIFAQDSHLQTGLARRQLFFLTSFCCITVAVEFPRSLPFPKVS